MLRSVIAAATLAGAILAPGCTTSEGEADAAHIDAQLGSFGMVRVERSVGDAADVATGRAGLSAVFARYEGIDGQHVLDLMGDEHAYLEIDTCAIANVELGQLGSDDATVELLDAGTLRVAVAGSQASMSARTFPELGSLVSGVFYAEDVDMAPARADLDEIRIEADGGAAVSEFEVTVIAPAALATVTLDGSAPDEVPALSRDRDLEILWDPGDPRDRVTVELLSGGQVIDCLARDDGMLRVSRELLSELDADEDARLLLRRMRNQPFDVSGVDVGWVSASASRTYPVAVR